MSNTQTAVVESKKQSLTVFNDYSSDKILSKVNFPIALERNIDGRVQEILTMNSENSIVLNWSIIEKYATKPMSEFDLVLQIFCKALWALKKEHKNVATALLPAQSIELESLD